MIGLLLLLAVSLVPGTSSTWTDGKNVWAGNSFCAEAGFLLSASSPAIDTGALIEGFHCPVAGPNPAGGCAEWYGSAPDIGACEFVPPAATPNPPSDLKADSV